MRAHAAAGASTGAAGTSLGLDVQLSQKLAAAWQWLQAVGKRPPAPPPGKKRVLILMSDTGGGHRASAQALRDTFERLYGSEFEVVILDLWTDSSPWPMNQMPKGYSFMVRYPFLWRLNFRGFWPSWVHGPTLFMTHKVAGRAYAKVFHELQPDLVVSVHPLMQHVPLKTLRNMHRRGQLHRVPFATVVTDFTTCHSTWFHRKVDQCYVATPEARDLALSRGLKPSQLIMHGLPIRPVFEELSRRRPAKGPLRARLGMDRSRPAVLVVGGGGGMGPVEATCQAIASTLRDRVQVVVICGRNKALVKKLEGQEWPMPLIVNGFVSNMHEWMAASNCIVTKAGPGTIAEALVCGLPLFLNGFVPCQEEGNIPFVISNQVGAFSRDPQEVARILKGWLQNRAEFESMAQRARALGKPEATFEIVKDLAVLARAHGRAAPRKKKWWGSQKEPEPEPATPPAA